MSETTTTSTVPEWTVAELRERLAAGEPVTVLDLRSEEAFREWRIPGSRRWRDGSDDEAPGASPAVDDLPAEGPVVAVCPSGNRSRDLALRLREEGRDAYSLRGGLRAWSLAWNVAEAAPGGAAARVVQVRRTAKGCLSYLVGSGGEALVVDAAADPDVFREAAERRGWRIVGILETHVHADHVSRAPGLAAAVGAPLYLPAGAGVDRPHRRLSEGDAVRVGEVELRVLETPGHTPESVAYRLGDAAVFTGDTLFLDGVGRPDLDVDAEGAREKARRLHRSLGRLAALPDETLVLPAHTDPPVAFDGVMVGARLARVRSRVPTLSLPADEFVERVLAHRPETPAHHDEILRRNRRGGRREADQPVDDSFDDRSTDGPSGDDYPTDDDLAELEAGANRCAAGG